MKLRQISLVAAGVGLGMLALAGSANAGASVCDAVTGNLLSNCGFETGDLSSWTTNEDPTANFSGVEPALQNSGNFGFFGGSSNLFEISQQITDTPGATLTISGFLASLLGGTPNEFQILLNNVVLLDVTDFTNTSYTQQSITGLATGTDTIGFAFSDEPDFLLFDDAVVTAASTAVPEPASVLVLGAGLLGLGAFRRRQKTR